MGTFACLLKQQIIDKRYLLPTKENKHQFSFLVCSKKTDIAVSAFHLQQKTEVAVSSVVRIHTYMHIYIYIETAAHTHIYSAFQMENGGLGDFP
jgi:hypothetical protein